MGVLGEKENESKRKNLFELLNNKNGHRWWRSRAMLSWGSYGCLGGAVHQAAGFLSLELRRKTSQENMWNNQHMITEAQKKYREKRRQPRTQAMEGKQGQRSSTWRNSRGTARKVQRKSGGSNVTVLREWENFDNKWQHLLCRQGAEWHMDREGLLVGPPRGSLWP